MDYLKRFLMQNGFPIGIINYHLKHEMPKVPAQTVPKKEINVLLPYLGNGLSVDKALKNCVESFYGYIEINIIFTNQHRIGSMFPYKDRLPQSKTSKVIYRASCWDCNATNIGKTIKHLEEHKKEHFEARTIYIQHL